MHFLLVLMISAITSSSASATSFYIRPFSEFIQSTENIVRGKLNGIHVENGVTADGGKTIYTFATLIIGEVLKGSITGTQIIVRKVGGSKDGVTLEIPSSVVFSENEEGVFFLTSEQEDHSFEVTGMELGKFGIEQNNGEEILTGGIFAYSRIPDGVPHDPNEPDRLAENKKPWSITQLRKVIQEQNQAPAAVPNNQKNTEVSNTSVIKTNTPAPITKTSESTSTLSQGNENSSIYSASKLWYILATIALSALGVLFYLRRG